MRRWMKTERSGTKELITDVSPLQGLFPAYPAMGAVMDLLQLLIDGVVLSALMIVAFDERRRGSASRLLLPGLIFMVLRVYFIYRHQENSDLFFWHGYLAWTLANLACLAAGLMKGKDDRKKLLRERLLLWQVVVVTVFAGFSLTLGWLLKLYVGVFIKGV